MRKCESEKKSIYYDINVRKRNEEKKKKKRRNEKKAMPIEKMT